jgi:hypothetical protein
MSSHLTTIGKKTLTKALILKSKQFRLMEKKSECKFGILLVNKDSKPSLRHITKEQWVSLWFMPLMICNLLMLYKIG